ncbi:MAG TPA: hypothetical protein VJ877_03265, partial [Bacteroidales bacterium]|nr:hypothetical protein [Bacteroidales bacterium]
RAIELQDDIIAYNKKYKSFIDIRKNLTKAKELSPEGSDFADKHKAVYDTVNKAYNEIIRSLTNRREGLSRDMYGINVLYTATDELTKEEEKSVSKAIDAMNKATEMIDKFISEEWEEYLEFFRVNNITIDKIFR